MGNINNQKNTKRATPGMKYVVHTTSSDDIRVDNIEVPVW